MSISERAWKRSFLTAQTVMLNQRYTHTHTHTHTHTVLIIIDRCCMLWNIDIPCADRGDYSKIVADIISDSCEGWASRRCLDDAHHKLSVWYRRPHSGLTFNPLETRHAKPLLQWAYIIFSLSQSPVANRCSYSQIYSFVSTVDRFANIIDIAVKYILLFMLLIWCCCNCCSSVIYN